MRSREVSDFTLEQFLLDELPADEKARVERLAAEDAELRSRLERLDEDGKRFVDAVRTRAVLDAVRPRPERRTGPARAWTILMPAGLAAAAAIFLVPLALVQAAGPDTRVKGGSTLVPRPNGISQSLIHERQERISIFVLKDGKSAALPDGAEVKQGDEVQLAVSVGRSRGALLVSVDGAGHLTLHAPDSLKASWVGDGAPKLLPFAYQLDDAPYFERFVLITGSGSLDAQKIWNEVNAQTAAWVPGHPGQPPLWKLDSGLNLNTFDLRKSTKENP